MYFFNAGNLLTGDTLINVNGEDLIVSDCIIEECENPETVYNFQVEDYHTYFVGECGVWVHNAECVIEFNNKSGLDEKEFKKQLRDQQDGLCELTIDEYKKNREVYNKRKAETGNGRDPDSAKYQTQAKKEAIATKTKEFRNQGYSKTEAETMAKKCASDKAALHTPDQIAGGFADRISGMGDSGINSSIGPQWNSKDRIGKLDTYIQKQSLLHPGSTKLKELNITLVLK